MYVCNRRTKVIHTQACGFNKIMKNGTQGVDFRQAVDNGWRFCPHCSTVMKALKKERAQLDAFCRGKKLRYWAQDGMLIVATPSSFFRIVSAANGTGLHLWHQNGNACHKLEKFGHCHDQRENAQTLLTLFRRIQDHETFRQQRPAGVRPPKINERLPKGGKRYKRQQHRVEKYQKKVERINRANNIFFLLDQIKQEAARGA